MVTLAPQDRWSQDKHIKFGHIIGNPGARMLTRAMDNKLSVASAHECLFVDFLSKEEPKKVSKALKHPGWVDAMQASAMIMLITWVHTQPFRLLIILSLPDGQASWKLSHSNHG
nr:retrovirus-related Pol polyprotein from transposon TNT 1-94 [Tanacetum cinerariifolium]